MKISPAARPLRVLAAMSGGVDSAVAAARAAQAGHDVTGVHLALSSNPQSYRTGARGCCTLEDSRDARRAADVIGIPFYVWDMAERFDRDVVQDFVAEYAAGRTPNPCLRCNEKIKFEAVLDRAVALGFDAVCTGHHARLLDGVLHRSPDAAKDQSYVLAVLRPDQLARAMFPLGDSTKEEVRAEARERGLQVADKPDSHDVCFIADGDTRGFLADRLGSETGPIIDAEGEVLGTHEGAYAFTVGQRKGLGLGRAPDGRPRYVLSIEPVNNTVTVGTADDLEVTVIEAARPVWSGIAAPEGPLDCLVQLRAHGDPLPATVEPLSPADVEPLSPAGAERLSPAGEVPRSPAEEVPLSRPGAGIRITLAVPARGVAAGQAAVLYDGDRVLGSATISCAQPTGTHPGAQPIGTHAAATHPAGADTAGADTAGADTAGADTAGSGAAGGAAPVAHASEVRLA